VRAFIEFIGGIGDPFLKNPFKKRPRFTRLSFEGKHGKDPFCHFKKLKSIGYFALWSNLDRRPFDKLNLRVESSIEAWGIHINRIQFNTYGRLDRTTLWHKSIPKLKRPVVREGGLSIIADERLAFLVHNLWSLTQHVSMLVIL